MWRHDLFQNACPRHAHHPQQRQPEGAAHAAAGLLPAGHRRRRRRRALERPDLALPAERPQGLQPQPGALRQGGRQRRRHDHPGLSASATTSSSPTTTPFDYLCGISRQGRQPERRDPGRRQSVRGAALGANTRTRRWRCPMRRPCSPRPRRAWATSPFRIRPATVSRPYANPARRAARACTYCGFCEKFGCGNYSKATAQTTILPSC